MYFKTINQILNNLYEFNFSFALNHNENNWYCCQTNIVSSYEWTILMYEIKVKILLLHYHFLYVVILAKTQPYCCMIMIFPSYDYAIDKCDLLNKWFDINDFMCYYTCFMYDVNLDEIKKDKKYHVFIMFWVCINIILL